MNSAHWKIVQPCDEPFEKMDVTERGLYCHRCEKEVLDLDGKTAGEVGYKKVGDICGRMTMVPEVAANPVGKWSSFMLRWLGVTALLFIPLKKSKSNVEKTGGNDREEKKVLSKTKRLIGTIRDENRRPLRTKVMLYDAGGNMLAETVSLANGRYLLQVDTPAIKTDTLNIVGLDTSQKVVLPASLIVGYPKDSFWIGPQQPYQLGGVPMQMDYFKFDPKCITFNSPAFTVVVDPEPKNAGDALEQEARAGIRGIEKA